MPKEVDIDEKRSEFIDASIEVISEQGLGAATMRRVAQQAGCTTGALTHYFANRHDLLVQTLRAVHDNAADRMTAAVDKTPLPVDQLRAVILESLPLDDARLMEWRVWLAFWGASMDDATLTAENDRRYKEWRDALATLLQPILPKKDRDAETEALLALVDGLGVGIARQFVGRAAMAQAQRKCSEILDRYLARLLAV